MCMENILWWLEAQPVENLPINLPREIEGKITKQKR